MSECGVMLVLASGREKRGLGVQVHPQLFSDVILTGTNQSQVLRQRVYCLSTLSQAGDKANTTSGLGVSSVGFSSLFTRIF